MLFLFRDQDSRFYLNVFRLFRLTEAICLIRVITEFIREHRYDLTV